MNAETTLTKPSVLGRAAGELDRIRPLVSTRVVTELVGELGACERAIRAELELWRERLPTFKGSPIATPEEYQAVGAAAVQIKQFRARVTELVEPVTKAMNALHKGSTSLLAEYDGPAKTLELQAKAALIDWDTRERRRLEAERQRLEAETRKAEEDRRLAQAAELEAKGRAAEAIALIDKPIVTPVVTAPPPPKPKGVSYTHTWVAVIVDREAIPDEYWVVDEQRIQTLAKKLGQALNIPGVEVRPQTNSSLRT